MLPPSAMEAAARLRVAADRLVNRVGHWNPARWAATPFPPIGADPLPGAIGAVVLRPRGDVFHELVQRLADLALDAEGLPRQPVPRLDNDLALVDQLRVVVADLLAAAPARELLDAAAAAIEDLSSAL